jgi:hypothetical protein
MGDVPANSGNSVRLVRINPTVNMQIFPILPVIFMKVRDLHNKYAGFEKYIWEYILLNRQRIALEMHVALVQ